MHNKEYYRASDDAKLLLMMLPPRDAQLYIFGRPGDLSAMIDELATDPQHTLILWPGEAALTVEDFVRQLPTNSAWRRTRNMAAAAPPQTLPLMRVVVIDGVYRNARMMFRHLLELQAARSLTVPHVALHPTTLSVYSRAQHGYAQALR